MFTLINFLKGVYHDRLSWKEQKCLKCHATKYQMKLPLAGKAVSCRISIFTKLSDKQSYLH